MPLSLDTRTPQGLSGPCSSGMDALEAPTSPAKFSFRAGTWGKVSVVAGQQGKAHGSIHFVF